MGRRAKGWTLKLHANGFYHVRFTIDGHREHRSTRQRSRAEAQKVAAMMVSNAKLARPSLTMPLEELLTQWLKAVRSEVTESTHAACWAVYARAHFIPFFGSTADLCSTRRIADYTRHRLSSVLRGTVKKELSALRRIFRWMVEQQLINEAPDVPVIPRHTVGQPHPNGKRRRIDLTPEEMEEIIVRLPMQTKNGALLRIFFMFMRETGLRPATLFRLKVPDAWDFGDTDLRISAAGIDKARYGRVVPLTMLAFSLLDVCAPTEGLIFHKFDARAPLRKAALKSGMSPERAALVSAYDFRHGRATELVQQTGDLVSVAYLLGHKHITTTNEYLHPNFAGAQRALYGQDFGQTDGGPKRLPLDDLRERMKKTWCGREDSNLHEFYLTRSLV